MGPGNSLHIDAIACIKPYYQAMRAHHRVQCGGIPDAFCSVPQRSTTYILAVFGDLVSQEI
jgi:hypothetical protein